jgi:hypothetical protein
MYVAVFRLCMSLYFAMIAAICSSIWKTCKTPNRLSNLKFPHQHNNEFLLGLVHISTTYFSWRNYDFRSVWYRFDSFSIKSVSCRSALQSLFQGKYCLGEVLTWTVTHRYPKKYDTDSIPFLWTWFSPVSSLMTANTAAPVSALINLMLGACHNQMNKCTASNSLANWLELQCW